MTHYDYYCTFYEYCCNYDCDFDYNYDVQKINRKPTFGQSSPLATPLWNNKQQNYYEYYY
jgi:hypothetical protein